MITATTPSGIEIEFRDKPRRQYRLRSDELTSDWQIVPSVTTVLDVLHKPALLWWSQGIGVLAVLQLVEDGLLIWKED